MDFGIYEDYRIPPFYDGGDASYERRMIALFLQEVEVLRFISLEEEISSLIVFIVSQFPDNLMAKVKRRSAQRLCYIWDWIELLEEYGLSEVLPLDERSERESAVFLLQLYHLCDNVRSLRFVKLSPPQFVAYRYIPLQAQLFIQLDEQDTRKWKIFNHDQNPVPTVVVKEGMQNDEARRVQNELIRPHRFEYAFQYADPNIFLVYPHWTMRDLSFVALKDARLHHHHRT